MLGYIIWFNLIIISNYFAAAYAQVRAELLIKTPYEALPDVLQENLPVLPKYIPDYILIALGCCIYFLDMATPLHEWNNLLCCLSLRPIFVCMTTFPTCMKKSKSPKMIIHQILHSTHDLMFSGHTCWFMFFGELIGGYTGNIVSFVLPLSLVQAKQHYTIDVVVSMLVYNAVSQVVLF